MTKTKTYFLYILLAIPVLLGAYFLTTEKPAPAPSSQSSEELAGGGGSAEEPTVLASTTEEGGVPGGFRVVRQTAWATFNDPTWSLVVKYQAGWKFSTTKTEDRVTGASISASSFSAIIQKDMRIAEPSLAVYTTSTQTIAGQSVEVRTYTNPNEKYAFYRYFMLSDGNDEFHVSIRSTTADTTDTDAFIEHLSMQ